MLKYTPEHMHCLANIYGALAPPSTGVLAIQSARADMKARIPLALCHSSCTPLAIYACKCAHIFRVIPSRARSAGICMILRASTMT